MNYGNMEHPRMAVFLKFFQKDIFWILLLAFTFRNIYQQLYGGVFYNADTVSYTYAANNIFKGIIDELRTPGYPIFMRIVQILGDGNFLSDIITAQHVFSFLSIIPFYYICKSWIKSRVLVFFVSIIFALHPILLNYNNAIFPESILISSIVVLLYFISTLLKAFSWRKLVLAQLVLLWLIMLKPGMVVLCVLINTTLFFHLYKNRGSHLLPGFMGIIMIVFALLGGYCWLNEKQNEVFALSTVTHDNNFMNVILSSAYKEFPDQRLVSIIDTTIQTGKYYTVYYLNNDFEKNKKRFESFPDYYPYTENMRSIQRIPGNSYGYDRENIDSLVKRAMKTRSYSSYLIWKFGAFAQRNFFGVRGVIIYLILMLDFLLITFFLFGKRKWKWFNIFLLISAAGLIVTSILAGIDDDTWERVLLPVIPFLLILIGIFIDNLYYLVKEKQKMINE
jgi:hypothetical protein